ncbi:MAG: SDR family NAD(P)-dependent oxidoreductase, partial [Flavobacteriales bacterium]
MDLKNKVALTAGGTGGIGMASAIQMSKMGASVILLARNEAKLKDTLSKLDSSNGQSHSYLVADFSNEDSLNVVCEEIKNNKIDILLHNTGGPAGGPIIDADPAAFLNT